MNDMSAARQCIVRGIGHQTMADAMREGRNTVFTLNLMHLRILSQDEDFRESYRQASLISLDSNCLNILFLQRGMTVCTGSDFVHHLRTSGALQDKSALLIGNSTADDARRVMPCREMHVVKPPFGFIRDANAVADVVAHVRSLDPDVVFIAVGAPQSEKLALHLRQAGVRRASILCCGAAFDFETGAQKRSPWFVSRMGGEWLWRLAVEPRRLARRYAADAMFMISLLGQLRSLAASRMLSVGGLRLEFVEEARARTALPGLPLTLAGGRPGRSAGVATS